MKLSDFGRKRFSLRIFHEGGAAGIHAFPLAKQGYRVHLIDPVELHLEQARTYAATSGVTLASITRGGATAAF